MTSPKLSLSTLICGLSLAFAPACGTDSGTEDGTEAEAGTGESSASAGTEAEATTEAEAEATTGDGDGDTSTEAEATTGDGDGDTTTGDGDGDTTTGDGDGDGDCMVWEIEYELDGSVFEITGTTAGAGDAEIPLETPYADADTIGPGTLTMAFTDNAGAPGDGPAALIDYDVTMNFEGGGFGTVVTQTLQITTADACGSATGALSGTNVGWTPNVLNDYHTTGNINCSGGACGSFGAPPAGDNPQDETTDIDPFSAFTFAAGLGSFTAPQFETSSDANATTFMELVGTEVSRNLVSGPACLCQ